MDKELFKFYFNKLNVSKLIEDLYHFINEMSLIIYNSFSEEIQKSCLIYEIGVERYDLVDVCITYCFDVIELRKSINPEELMVLIENNFNCRVELKYLDEKQTQCHIYVYII